MKKITLLFAFIFSMFILPIQVLAVDFSIDKTTIHSYLQENGDVKVTEQYTYTFDGDFNGITRTLIPKENTQITNFQAFESNQALNVEQDDNLYKIHRKGSDQKITIDLSYTIKNGVEVYTDMAEFYWPFFDSSNEATYHSMDIYIHPPKPTEQVLALGYDQAYKTNTSDPDSVVHFAMGEVESGTNGDIRVAYDAVLFPSVTEINNTTIRDDILADQTKLEEQAHAYENRRALLKTIAPYVIAIFFIFLSVLLFKAWSKRKQTQWEAQRSSAQLQSLPSNEMSLPANIYYMHPSSPGGELISASLLDLVRKGYVEQAGENEFIVVNKSTEHQHEQLLINWLFYKIGENGHFTLKDVESYIGNKENHSVYREDFDTWFKAVRAEVNKQHLSETKKGLRWTVGVSSILLIPFTISLGVHSLFMWMSISIILNLALLLFAILYQPKTVQGLRIKQQWQTFSSSYDTISWKEWNNWLNDEQMQAFIYSVGTGNKQLKNKSESLFKGLSSSMMNYSGIQTNEVLVFILLSNMMTEEFNEANTTVYAHSTGGVSGGGSGVGGGGGGSGAF